MSDVSEVSTPRLPAVLLVVTGVLGELASFILSADKVQLLKAEIADKSYVPACDLSAWVSCSGVMASKQSEAFGFPNSFLGVLGFAVVLTLGVVALAGSPLPRWIWAGLQAGALFGIGFVTWLQSQSIYDINRLCPYCMVVWAAMIPLFVGVTAHSLQLFAPSSAITRFVSNWKVLIVALWYVAVIAAIWFQFGTRLFT